MSGRFLDDLVSFVRWERQPRQKRYADGNAGRTASRIIVGLKRTVGPARRAPTPVGWLNFPTLMAKPQAFIFSTKQIAASHLTTHTFDSPRIVALDF